MSLATIGKILATHGVKGEVKVLPLMDDPDLLLDYEQFAVEGYNGKVAWYQVENIRFHKNMALIKFLEIPDMDQAELLKGSLLQIEEEDLPELPEGKYYISQLEGLKVSTDQGEYLGLLDYVMETGAKDVYVVIDKASNKEILLPNIPEVILKVDLEAGEMIVHLIPGLGD